MDLHIYLCRSILTILLLSTPQQSNILKLPTLIKKKKNKVKTLHTYSNKKVNEIKLPKITLTVFKITLTVRKKEEFIILPFEENGF